MMELALVCDQVRCDLADLHAIHHQAEMWRLHMVAAHFQAVRHGGREADRLAAQAFVDAMACRLG